MRVQGEPTLAQRKAWAERSVMAYLAAKEDPLIVTETDISDLIADLLHLAKSLPRGDTDRALRVARMYFHDEQKGHRHHAESR